VFEAVQTGYCLVRLRNGACSVRSLADGETFHPGIGPAAEAQALYVWQLRLPQRVRETSGELVIWDVGLGAAANALTAIRLIREELDGKSAQIRLLSFDRTSDAAVFALGHDRELGYLDGFEAPLAELIRSRLVNFTAGPVRVAWTLELSDFPAWLVAARRDAAPTRIEPPHVILFDPHSSRKNPAMWTASLFADLFRQLDPQRPCTLATFTRSTLARTALLLGGFFVGVGHPSGLKEETTVAANRLKLLDEPLDRRWLERAKRSDSAEPLAGSIYRRSPLAPATWETLRRHPQFQLRAGPNAPKLQ
jgi:tRNA U34 5-methylaminomethyl-2-thiouridine-forming methyltransferase MnmC